MSPRRGSKDNVFLSLSICLIESTMVSKDEYITDNDFCRLFDEVFSDEHGPNLDSPMLRVDLCQSCLGDSDGDDLQNTTIG